MFMSKKIKFLTGISFILIIIIALAIFSNPITSFSEPQSFNETITVNGIGSIETSPDEVRIRISVVSELETATDAAEMNSINMTAVFLELRKIGIDDVETKHYSITPIYRWVEIQDDNNRERIGKDRVLIGYRAINIIEVVCNPENAGIAIDAAIRGGANRIDSISFQLSDSLRGEIYNDALTKAVNNAKNKAETVAKAIGITEIHPIEIIVMDDYRWDFHDMRHPSFAMSPMVEAEFDTPIIPSDVKVLANVKIVYAF